MANVDWRLKGVIFGACNCNWGCPCQFNALPSTGQCTGGDTMRIDEGYFGDTDLDGLNWGMLCSWPGAVHEGNGTMFLYIDERADPKQRQALVEIAHGKHSQEGTMFNIFSAVCPTKLDPVFKPVEFDWNMDARRALVRVPGVLEITGEPIRNPVTDDEHYPRVVLPNGFEYKEAEFSSSAIRASGPIKLATTAGHGHFARVHWGPAGFMS
ncbi:MAG: DUF1326 domain-containing protein [Gammaproteobacteria bacterium]|nr:DUF1326 domain-containing protein [Gammaproteobacteria bacterium]